METMRIFSWLAVATSALGAGLLLSCSDQGVHKDEEEPGTSGLADIEVTPVNLEFGTLEMGSTSTGEVTISSVGDGDLEISGVHIEGPDHFSFEAEEIPLTLRPGDVTVAQITYTALDGLDAAAVFRIHSNDPDEEVVDVSLHGMGLGPAIVVDPPTWDFGSHPAYCEESVDLFVQSVGDSPVTISSWSFEASPSSTAMTWSTQELFEGLELMPGDSALITVNFHPEDVDSYEGHLVVEVEEEIPPGEATQIGEGTGGDGVTDTFIQEGNNQTDILWVVDNSCSMAEEQSTLADDFINFYSIVEAQAVDFRIAAVTTDDEHFLGQTTVIDHATPNGESVFAHNCQVGTDGDTTERGLHYGREALALAVSNTSPNAGFYRPAAGLRVVFVSDEMDSSGNWFTYTSNYQGLKTNPDHVILSAICGTDGVDAQSCWGAGGQAMAGYGYVDAVNATGGILASICDADWSQALTNLGWQSLSLADTFDLTEAPIPSTILVDVNGTHLNQGWHYDAVINAVVIEPAYVPADGDVIDITYQLPGGC